MLVYVVGASGSGKTTVAPHLRRLLDDWVVLDADALLDGATARDGSDAHTAPDRGPRADELLLAVTLDVLRSEVGCVVLGARGPEELRAWPVHRWLLLDCDDAERGRRLVDAGRSDDRDGALRDAARYRTQGLQTVDATTSAPSVVAEELASEIGRAEAMFREI
jgi:AAA domain